MGTELTKATDAAALAELADAGQRAGDYLAASVAANTVRGYRSDWRHFTAWCEAHGLAALPAAPDTVALYLAALADTHKPATLTRRTSAIAANHAAAGHASPTASPVVRKTLAGIRRAKGTAPRRARAFSVDDVRRIVAEHLPAGALGARDRALVLVGFTGALRRSELVGLDVEHLEFVGEGVKVTVPRSKTDQEGEGQTVAIPHGHVAATCPVRALRAWLELAGVTSGPVFRRVDRHGNVGAGRLTTKAVALVVKKYAAALGHDAAAYSGHSLRAGFATSAAAAGVQSRDIMRQTRHKSESMVAVYVREGNLFRANAAAALGL
jgi:integrase